MWIPPFCYMEAFAKLKKVDNGQAERLRRVSQLCGFRRFVIR
jgi:hypothetical protein